jgi:hypothetical protein
MICPVDITYEPFDCGPTVYVGNSVDGPAIAVVLAPIKADTTHETTLDDLLVMNFLPKRVYCLKENLKFIRATGDSDRWILLEVRVVVMTVM